MDLHFIPGAEPTSDERRAIDSAIGPRSERHLLLPALQAAQARVGWISEGALNYMCARLEVPPAEAYGVASFYHLFSLAPRPPAIAHVCDDIACRANGAEEVCAGLERLLGRAGSSALGGAATWLRSPCLGQCERAPAAFFQAAGEVPREWTRPRVTAQAIASELATATSHVSHEGPPGLRIPKPESRGPDLGARGPAPESRGPDPGARAPVPGSRDPVLRLLCRAGAIDPASLDDYRACGGYTALARAFELGPERVIREVIESCLVGRGGAAFPTGRKWDAVARAPVRPHYLVCNADESEPGTFKDRVLMEEDPYAVIEAMTIAGYATGCEKGFIYVRGEYPLAAERLAHAIGQTRERGLLGRDVLGQRVAFDIDLRRGSGAYICGEETALFNSIEGFRGEPRNKPPFPVESGLFGKPTVVNNVETLVNAIDIVLEGGQAFARVGTEGSAGSKLFCVSGTVPRPGLYEVPFGTTVRALIDLAGGVRDGRPLQAVLLGGAAGVFVSPDEIDLPLTFEGTRQAGATVGSGVVMVFDDRIDLKDIVLRIASFFRDESCGQCVPCRVGTVRQEEALRRLASGRPLGSRDTDIALIDEVARAMRDASICGLGHTASTAVQSAIRKFGLFEQARP